MTDTYNQHRGAIDMQDVGNLRALAREFVNVVDDAMEETKSTTATWADAAVRRFVNKFEFPRRSEAMFSEAHRDCSERANAPHPDDLRTDGYVRHSTPTGSND